MPSASERPAPPDAVHHPDQLTAAWLTQALRAGGTDARVETVSYEAVGTGQMGSSYRLHLTLCDGGDGVPSTLVVKLPAEDLETRAMVSSSYRTEVGFYRDLVDTLAVRTPGCHAAVANEDGSEFALLMDDLAPAEQGDQLGGATRAEAVAAVENLAGLHGPRWGDVSLAELDFLSLPDPEVADFMGELTRSAADVFVERYAGRLADDDAETMREAAGLMGAWLGARDDRWSLVHGDYRMDNLLFAPDGTVTAVDWQTVALGLPGRDLAYFCSTSLTVDDRREHEDDLVRAYHAALVAHGVDDHPLEECLDDYRFAMLHGPMIIILGAAYGSVTDRGDEMFLTMTARCCAAIRDHGTLDLVRAETGG